MTYHVEKIRCQCHPETCACFDFELLLNGSFIAASDDRDALEQIVATMNSASASQEATQSERHCVVCDATTGFTSPLNLCKKCEDAMNTPSETEVQR
jgi:hypothetical protein